MAPVKCGNTDRHISWSKLVTQFAGVKASNRGRLNLVNLIIPRCGPQSAIDVVATDYLGLINSQMAASGFAALGDEFLHRFAITYRDSCDCSRSWTRKLSNPTYLDRFLTTSFP
jgi:hypothetical protein